MTQPNDTERDTPTERKIKVECLNRFHLISGTKVQQKMHMCKKNEHFFENNRFIY